MKRLRQLFRNIAYLAKHDLKQLEAPTVSVKEFGRIQSILKHKEGKRTWQH